MLNDAVPVEDLVEHLQGPPAIHHVVLGDDFKPVDDRFLGEDVIVVGNAQAYPHAIIAKSIETIGWHYKAPVPRQLDCVTGGLKRLKPPVREYLKLPSASWSRQ